MSGGSWEYVMGNYNDVVGSSGFVSMPESKYYDKYTSDDLIKACNGKECISHGLSETVRWYDDNLNMESEDYVWTLRSGGFKTLSPGIFYITDNSSNGNMDSSDTFRLVATIK